MKLENLVFDFDRFASEMASLKENKHFDYLVLRKVWDASTSWRTPTPTSVAA